MHLLCDWSSNTSTYMRLVRAHSARLHCDRILTKALTHHIAQCTNKRLVVVRHCQHARDVLTCRKVPSDTFSSSTITPLGFVNVALGIALALRPSTIMIKSCTELSTGNKKLPLHVLSVAMSIP